MLTTIAPRRGTDTWGSGAFGASRGNRLHMGVDFVTAPESTLLSPVKGEVTKLGYPYGDDLSYRYVEITDKDGSRHRFFYVEPLVDLRQKVRKGDKIGIVQDVTRRYPVPIGMKVHVHYEIINKDGLYEEPGRGY